MKPSGSQYQLTCAAAEAIAYPVVIKPNIGGSGAGIERFNLKEELRAAVEANRLYFGIDSTALVQEAFTARDVQLASQLKKMDDVVDNIYLDFVKKSAQVPEGNLKCFVSGTLILRYLERIADHATYVGETVLYIVSGERAARK